MSAILFQALSRGNVDGAEKHKGYRSGRARVERAKAEREKKEMEQAEKDQKPAAPAF